MKQIVISFPSAEDVGASAVRRRRIFPAGSSYDLAAIMDDLNVRFFGGSVEAAITWGRARASSRRRRRRRHITLGSYCRRRKIITIHPHLDREGIPRYFVEAIVFHEMCHQVAGEERAGGVRRIHTPKFKELERRYPMFAEAKRWAKANFTYLLGGEAPAMTNEQASRSGPAAS